jgi:hypothetical protein
VSPPIKAEAVQRAFRVAALRVHPDHGGTEREMRALMKARDMLLEHAAGGQTVHEHATRQETPRASKWFRSRRGNLCCKINGQLVTVFGIDDGYKWVSEGMFSPKRWDTEWEACDDAEDYWAE